MASKEDVKEKDMYEVFLNHIENGDNIFLTGPGGVGKSYYIKKFKNDHKNIPIYITSTTGVSAFNLGLGSRTIHSFSGIGALKRNDTLVSVMKRVVKTQKQEQIKECQILVIDEISMLGKFYIEMIDKVFKTVRSSTKPFGGIQVIFTGDFLQLPPVDDEFCFHSDVWNQLSLKTIYLTKMYRVNDPIYTSILERVRMAKHTPDDNRELYKRFHAYQALENANERNEKEPGVEDSKDQKNLTIQPTFLYSKKVNVYGKNMEELEKNPNQLLIFVPTIIPGKKNVKVYVNEEDDRKLLLKVGAQVMLNVNLDVENGLVNGSRGVVTAYENSLLYVKFMDGRVQCFDRHEFVYEEDGTVLYKVLQYPFILAYALSIHKIQGCTLDCAIIDIGYSVFEASMSYVALSRVKNLDGLYLKSFQPHKIFCHKDALEFYENLN